ncbi:MAG: P22 phage major capsid protein family protein, partial [Pseudomonadota bacterium]
TDRYLALSTRDYNGMASDLAKNTRSFGNDISDSALRRAYVGRLASFETYKLDYAVRKAAAAGGAGITTSTLTAANQYWIPRATQVASTGETANVDNRFQTITTTTNTNVAAGDSFTIANVFAVHHITKQSTGVLKTFRVISVPSSTSLVISPPIISAQGGTDAELQNQNCVVTSQASNAAIVFLNTASGNMHPFWQREALEILPGRFAVPTDAGAAVMRASTDQGIELVMTKQYDINTMKTKYRLDTLYGVVNKQPEMSGIVMFSQP